MVCSRIRSPGSWMEAPFGPWQFHGQLQGSSMKNVAPIKCAKSALFFFFSDLGGGPPLNRAMASVRVGSLAMPGQHHHLCFGSFWRA